MCGIWCMIQYTKYCKQEYIENIIHSVSKLLVHRGPDSFNYKLIECGDKTIIMIHLRLHIIGEYMPQPIVKDNISLIINGEIFNWKELGKELEYECTQSDCEILIPLYKKYIKENNDFDSFYNKINGQFSFILYDNDTGNILVSRDHIGITPLYYGYDDNKVVFCSEMKGLTINPDEKSSFLENIKVFEPRKYLYSNILVSECNNIVKDCYNYLDYYNFEYNSSECNNSSIIKKNIKSKLETSVYAQLIDLINLNIEFGVLLSGGLDSSLIASIISKTDTLKTRVKTFSIGICKDSTDLIASRKVAEFLNTDHYEFYFTIEEGIKSIKDVIWYIESYDTTTVRASTAMYLLTKKIKEKFPKLKVLFSGELSDEMLSYVYGSNAPSELDFQNETIRLVSDVHLFDCLRANKSCMSNGIEARVPFTDPDFVKYMLSIPPKFKIFGKLNNYKTIEKQILRDAFNINHKDGKPYLPIEILKRGKEAFSDGVSSHVNGIKENWVDSVIQFCDKKYTDAIFNLKTNRYHYNKPETKEQLYYRELFCELFNKKYMNTSELTVGFWKPKWCGVGIIDPSARKHIKEQFN